MKRYAVEGVGQFVPSILAGRDTSSARASQAATDLMIELSLNGPEIAVSMEDGNLVLTVGGERREISRDGSEERFDPNGDDHLWALGWGSRVIRKGTRS